MATTGGCSRMESTYHRLYEFAKIALIKIFVSPYATVCDLYCGGGADVEKWDEAQIGHYIGIDVSSSGISGVREVLESQRKTYTSEFYEFDPSLENIDVHLQEKGNLADVVCCLQHLQLCFENEERVRRLLHNVSSLLKPGGYFFGITPDSSTIWAKYQKNVEAYHNKSSSMKPSIVPNCIRSESYMITFEVEEEKFPFFGKKYQLKFANEMSVETHCLVHFPSLLRLAREAGLEYVEIQNLTDFYDDNRVQFASMLGNLVDARGKLHTRPFDILGLYTTFIFQKPDPNIVPPFMTASFENGSYSRDERKTKLHLKFYKLHIYFAALKKKLGPYTMVTFKDVNTPKRNTLVISDDDEAGAKTTLNTFEPIIGKFAQKWKASVKPPALESWTKGNVLYSSHHCKATDELYPHLIDNIMKDKAIWGSNVKFNGEFHFIPSYWEWTEEVLSRNQKVLRDAQLYDAIYASLFTYSQDVNIIRSFCEFWCATTNTLHTQSGEVSISLWDLHVIGGLSIEGIFYDEVVPTAKELTSVDQKGNLLLPKSCHYLLTAYHYLKKTKKGKISPIDWINFWYKGEVRYTSTTQKKSRKAASSYPSGSFKISPPLPVAHEALTILEVEENLHEETYLAAFLSCWLCVFALPNKDGIRPSTFKIASLMAKGRIISLAIPVLAAIYQGLKVISLSSVPGKDKSYFPFHYVYAWLGRYFKTHEPINHLVNGPYMTKISGEQAIKHIDLASSYKCIAFGRGIVWNTTTMIRKTESIFVDDGKLNLSKLSYFFSLRSGYLTLRQEDSYIIHHYSPHRYSRQFGFHQDLPGDITRHIISANAEEMFQYHETLIGLNTKSTIFIPAFSIDFSSRFTARFKEWWSSLHGNYFVDAVKTMVKSPPTKEKASLLKTAMPKVPESSDETPEASAAPRTLNNVRTTLRVISTPVQCFPISHDQEYQRGCERGSPSKKHSREQLRIHEVLCDDEADVQSEECWRHAKRQNIQMLRDVINNSQSPIGNQEHVSFGNISDLASKKENELSHTNAEVSNIFKNKDDEVSSQSNHGCNQPRKNMILVEQSVFSSTNLIPKFRYNHCRELGLATLKEFSKCTLDGVIPFGRHFENVCSEIDGSGVVSSAPLRNIFHEFSERVRRHLSNGLELKDASTIDDHDVHTSKIRAQLDININHDLSLSEKIASLQDQSLEITMEIERLKRKQAIINSSILEMEDDQKEVKSNISTLQEDLVKLQNVPLLDEAEMEAFKKTQALLEKELADFKNLKWLD